MDSKYVCVQNEVCQTHWVVLITYAVSFDFGRLSELISIVQQIGSVSNSNVSKLNRKDGETLSNSYLERQFALLSCLSESAQAILDTIIRDQSPEYDRESSPGYCLESVESSDIHGLMDEVSAGCIYETQSQNVKLTYPQRWCRIVISGNCGHNVNYVICCCFSLFSFFTK